MPEFLDRAATSLKHWKERVERLKIRKEELEKEVNHNVELRNDEPRLKVVRIMEAEDMTLEVILILMGSNKQKVVPFEVLRVIEQGGTEITSSSFWTIGHHIYCTIHAQVHIIYSSITL